MHKLQGKRFGKLTVVERNGANSHGEATWLCQCDCGNKTVVNAYALVHGHTKSCGCLVQEKIIEATTTHGLSKTKLYYVYSNMMTRCYNPKYKYFKNYGGRGIQVCDEWIGKDGKKRFFEWAKNNGYSDDLSLDRINVNENYCPSNCRWTTMKEQQNNRTNNSLYEYNGQIKTRAEWADLLGIKYSRLQRLLKTKTLGETIVWLESGAKLNSKTNCQRSLLS